MANIIIAAILIVILGLAVIYIVKAKRRGHKCIGCPDGACCPSAGNCTKCSNERK